MSKIIPALQSRCTRFRFAPLGEAHVTARLAHVIAAEGVACDEGGMQAVVRLGAGDMRRTLNILQSTFMSSGQVNVRSGPIQYTRPFFPESVTLLSLIFMT